MKIHKGLRENHARALQVDMDFLFYGQGKSWNFILFHFIEGPRSEERALKFSGCLKEDYAHAC